ncbi:MAG: NAD-dependent epimerase/dehydratase family protein [Burkholderiales bacterium]|nr:NAD-dependent epimerase/dehydratase family protein [Burkholderiales bacterium]
MAAFVPRSPQPILVTGASGFAGTALMDALRGRGYSALRVVRKPGKLDACTAVVPLIDGRTDWSQMVSGTAAVIHLAARVHVMDDSASDPLAEVRRTNVDGTLKLGNQAARGGVQRFVFVSSIEANGASTP